MTASNQLMVVVGVDGSTEARAAALWAASFAAREGGPLQVVHALPEPLYTAADIGVIRQGPAIAQMRLHGRRILDETAEEVHRRFPHLEVSTDLEPGPAARALASAGGRARLVVIGSSGGGRIRSVLMGRTAMGLARHTSCPVMIRRGAPGPGPDADHRPVVVGVDGTERGAGAVWCAFEYAHLVGAPVVAVHAWSARDAAGGVTIPYLIDWETLEDEQQELLVARVAAAAHRFPDVLVDHVVTRVDAGRALVERSVAVGAQLVVVGTAGHGSLPAALLGSTSLRLLEHSACPVMICPALPHVRRSPRPAESGGVPRG